jgi:hypothetical protein
MNTRKEKVKTKSTKVNTPVVDNPNTSIQEVNTPVDNVSASVDNLNTDEPEVNTEVNTCIQEVNTPVDNLNTDEPEVHTEVNTPVDNANTLDEHREFSQSLQPNAEKTQPMSLRVFESDFDFWSEFKLKYPTQSEAFSALVKMANKEPEIKEIEKPIEVNIELTPAQVIVTFGKETADKIRLCRPFISQGDVLSYERGNNASFINALVNFSVSKTLERNFPGVLRISRVKNDNRKSNPPA